jgi:1D-myo-inositol-tetrakisphosphate 5-kinase/inositol-polyphosphate multikinase
MVGQVGGVSTHKRPLLTLEPDYALKPLNQDHRGIREIAFYEVIRISSQNSSNNQEYAAFLAGKPDTATGLDVLAMCFALWFCDKHVADFEERLLNSRKALKKEVELLRRLEKFTPSYYGVTRHNSAHSYATTPYEVTPDSYLLLQDITSNFSKPCVMDLKMGAQSYEPDAPESKCTREYNKYPQQSTFGMRIVGMRIYDPSYPNADENGFRFFPKEFGRSLSTRDDLSDALRTYFGAGTPKEFQSTSAALNESTKTRSIINILALLQSLRRWFEDNKVISFFASSLLIVYEGNHKSGANPYMVNVKMIDFGRVRRQPGGDPGYLIGLTTLRDLLVNLLEDPSREIAGPVSFVSPSNNSLAIFN